MERYVGDVWERKLYEYTVVSKIPHASKDDVFVYLIAKREIGFVNVEYYMEEIKI